jgi:hypothetical protein
VHDTTLPAGLRVALGRRLDQAQALVADRQPHAGQAALLEVAQEGAPALGVLLGPLHHPQHLAEAVGTHAHRHQHGHVADLAAPAPLEPDAVQVDVRVLARQRPVPPGLDVPGDLLVQLADGAGADAAAPEGLGDVLHPKQIQERRRLRLLAFKGMEFKRAQLDGHNHPRGQ